MAYTSVFTLFAELFEEMAGETVKRFGKDGEEAVKSAVRNFGKKRGRRIAENARAKGVPNTLENFLSSYDMERAAEFKTDTEQDAAHIKQVYERCPFAALWLKDGADELGKLYCAEIDKAIIKGYNEELKHEQTKHLLAGDDVCEMCFTLRRES